MPKAISDSLNLTISISFLFKILAVTAIVVGSYYQTTSKMSDMERTIAEMHSEIIILNSKMAKMETEKVENLEEENKSLLQRMGLKKP